MADQLLRLRTPEWELTIWCNDNQKRQETLLNTLHHRQEDFSHLQSELRFAHTIFVEELSVGSEEILLSESLGQQEKITLAAPLFFENSQYQFEWVFFKEGVTHAAIHHKLKSIQNSFRFSLPRKDLGGLASLSGVINTANDIGWLRLPLMYYMSDITHDIAISLEVLPTKMVPHSDLPAMYKVIDQEFPLWRFSLVQKTEQASAKGKERGHFSLLWLAHFELLREKLTAGLKVISQSPHSRLQPVIKNLKADNLKGVISHKLAEKVVQDIRGGLTEKRYQQSHKKLSVDTPENRYIKMVVNTTKQRLADFHNRLVKNNRAPHKQRLSQSFLDQIHTWQQPLAKIQKQGLFREVGEFSGLAVESLVLQQKTGYSTVYRVWQELKFYLNVFANQSSVSMKSIAEIYEVWCFLEVRRILTDALGFTEVSSQKNKPSMQGVEYQLTNGFGGAFNFTRSDGVRIRLAHEPVFSKNGATLKTFLVSQKPDILMEVTFTDGKKCIWLFDAKYRIKTQDDETEDELLDESASLIDWVPEDAINQMHRYRDALIHISKNQEQKSRPVFGAFALYPGYFDQSNTENPYADAIKEIGIGAFALLPSPNTNKGNHWLTHYLIQQIGLVNNVESLNNAYPLKAESEHLYIQEAARIPYYGMKQVLYSDLVMTIALTGASGRTKEYFEKFKNGSARFYHMPLSTFEAKLKKIVPNELRYLAIAFNDSDPHEKVIEWLWPIKNVSVVPRHSLTQEQAGSLKNNNEEYCLFELNKPLALKDRITHVPHRPIARTIKLTTLAYINHTSRFSEIKTVYDKV